MEKRVISTLHPDLVINQEAAIDRMGATAMLSLEQGSPTATKQVQIVRQVARRLCSDYQNCRVEDWCWHCQSGQHGALYRGSLCLGCKLLTADAVKSHKKLVQIETLPGIDLHSST